MLSHTFSNGLATPECEAMDCIRSCLRGVESHSSDILRQQAANNSKQQFASSPDLPAELLNAIIGAMA